MDTLWTRPFILLNGVTLMVFMNIGLLYLYPLALQAHGMDKKTIGWVMGIFSLAAVLSRPLAGKMIGRYGEKRLISLGMAATFLASMGYALVGPAGVTVFLVRVVHGVGFSACVAGIFSLAARGVSPFKRGAAFGWVGASIMLGVAVAPALGERLIAATGFGGLYLAAGFTMCLGSMALVLGLRNTTLFSSLEKGSRVAYLPVLKEGAFLWLLASALILAHLQATVTNFLALMAHQQGAGSGRFFFVAFATAIFVLIFLGGLMDRYGKRPVAALAYPVFCLSLIVMPTTLAGPAFLAPALLFGVGLGFLFSSHNALAASHGTMREKPAFMSVFTAVYDTGFVTGALISGWIAHGYGLYALFVSTGFFGFLGLLIVLLAPLEP